MDQVKAMRRGCTRVGIAMLVYTLAVNISFALIQAIVQVCYPEILSNSSFTMALNDLCAYLIGGGALYLVIRPLPTASLPQRSVTPLRMGKLALESIGAMYGANLITVCIIAVISGLSGLDTGNLLDSVAEDMSIWAMLIFMVVLAPICEEIMFRRILFRRLLPMGQGFAVVISALMFGLFHTNLYQFFYAVALGLLFGCVVAKTGRIRYTIVLHALLNFMGSVLPTLAASSDIISTVLTIILYVLMAAGIVVMIGDRRALAPEGRSLPGCWRASFTSPGLLSYIVLSGIFSVVVLFLV